MCGTLDKTQLEYVDLNLTLVEGEWLASQRLSFLTYKLDCDICSTEWCGNEKVPFPEGGSTH